MYKRKCLNESKKGKGNSQSNKFPDEEISSSREFTMNPSRSYIQEWLDKNAIIFIRPQPCSPFSDLKVNTHHNQSYSTPLKDAQIENDAELGTRQSNRKRSRLKLTPSTPSNTSLENDLEPVGKGGPKKAWGGKRLKQEFDDTTKHVVQDQCNENENVIECFTIEDSQDQMVDKDWLALLAVQNAGLQETVETIQDSEDISHKVPHVPFLKKSYLFENCSQRIDVSKEMLTDMEHQSNKTFPAKSSDVSITVENKSFIATISIVDCTPSKKQSTAVQTIDHEPFLGFEQSSEEESLSLTSKIKEYIEITEPETDSQNTSCTVSFGERKESSTSKIKEYIEITEPETDSQNTSCTVSFGERKESSTSKIKEYIEITEPETDSQNTSCTVSFGETKESRGSKCGLQ